MNNEKVQLGNPKGWSQPLSGKVAYKSFQLESLSDI